jgi:hypothetical protein
MFLFCFFGGGGEILVVKGWAIFRYWASVTYWERLLTLTAIKIAGRWSRYKLQVGPTFFLAPVAGALWEAFQKTKDALDLLEYRGCHLICAILCDTRNRVAEIL